MGESAGRTQRKYSSMAHLLRAMHDVIYSVKAAYAEPPKRRAILPSKEQKLELPLQVSYGENSECVGGSAVDSIERLRLRWSVVREGIGQMIAVNERVLISPRVCVVHRWFSVRSRARDETSQMVLPKEAPRVVMEKTACDVVVGLVPETAL